MQSNFIQNFVIRNFSVISKLRKSGVTWLEISMLARRDNSFDSYRNLHEVLREAFCRIITERSNLRQAKTSITTFVFNNDQSVRTFDFNGEVWFVAKDVCDILGIGNVSRAVENLDHDKQGVANIYTQGGIRNMTVISEQGVSALVINSKKKEAKKFYRWIRHDVLPSIPRTVRLKDEHVVSEEAHR